MELSVTEKALIGNRLKNSGIIGLLCFVENWLHEVDFTSLKVDMAHHLARQHSDDVVYKSIINFLEDI